MDVCFAIWFRMNFICFENEQQSRVFFYDGLRGVFEIKINNVIRNIKNNVFEIKKKCENKSCIISYFWDICVTNGDFTT